MKLRNVKVALLALTTIGIMSSCSSDDDANAKTYNTSVSITDAPIDNANVSGAFVTITDVKVDGNSISGFNKTTLDLTAYQKGNTKLLGNIDLENKTYSNISLVLDYAADANGNAPGCYVLTADNTKHALASASNEISISDSFEVVESSANEMVIDFDLRKSIIAQAQSEDEFDFVTASELSNSLRIANTLESGEISGNVTDSQNTSEKIIVYAYEKGSFDAATETSGQGASEVMFSNAITSAVVDDSNSYELHFLKEGEYELHFASYNDDDNDNEYEFTAMLNVESSTSLNIGSLQISAHSQLSASVLVLGYMQ